MSLHVFSLVTYFWVFLLIPHFTLTSSVVTGQPIIGTSRTSTPSSTPPLDTLCCILVVVVVVPIPIPVIIICHHLSSFVIIPIPPPHPLFPIVMFLWWWWLSPSSPLSLFPLSFLVWVIVITLCHLVSNNKMKMYFFACRGWGPPSLVSVILRVFSGSPVHYHHHVLTPFPSLALLLCYCQPYPTCEQQWSWVLGSCSFVSGGRGLTWQGLPASCFVILTLNETLTSCFDG